MKLIQNQKLCRYHANQMWEEYPDMTLIIQNVDSVYDCDECMLLAKGLLETLQRHPEAVEEAKKLMKRGEITNGKTS